MSASIFLHATAVEAALAAGLFLASRIWRRFGPRQVLGGVALAAVVWELVDLVRHGHVTPRVQALAFLAIAFYASGVLADRQARAALVPRRVMRRWR
jgi:hypothetical protein